MHPFIDATNLTDEEIIERLGKAYSYMNYQVSLGHNPTVRSIKDVIQSLEDERFKRLNNTVTEETKKKFPNLDNPITLGELEKRGKKKSRPIGSLLQIHFLFRLRNSPNKRKLLSHHISMSIPQLFSIRWSARSHL